MAVPSSCFRVGSKAEVATGLVHVRLAAEIRLFQHPPYGFCSPAVFLPNVISGRRRPIAIQAVISRNMALPE